MPDPVQTTTTPATTTAAATTSTDAGKTTTAATTSTDQNKTTSTAAATDTGKTAAADTTKTDTNADKTDKTDKTDKAGEIPATAEDYAKILKAPEGQELDASRVAVYAKVFTDAKIPPAAAQALIDASFQENAAIEAAVAKQNAEWVSQWKAQPDAEAKTQAVAVARDWIGDPDFVATLDAAGVGNHPKVLAALAKFGGLLKEGSFKAGSGNTGSPIKSAIDLYPSMRQ